MSKLSYTLLYLISFKIVVLMTGKNKMLVRISNSKDLIRLLLQKQSGLGLHCLSRPI